MALLYGVDLDGEITPQMARDALAQCFFEAHCIDTGIDASDSEVNMIYCRDTVKKAFSDSGGDFDNPTKESIIATMEKLKEFSANFRDPSIIEKHAAEMSRIVEKVR